MPSISTEQSDERDEYHTMCALVDRDGAAMRASDCPRIERTMVMATGAKEMTYAEAGFRMVGLSSNCFTHDYCD